MHICTALKVKNLLSSSPSSHEIGIWTGWSANPVTSFSTDQPVTTPLANNNEHNGIFISYSLWVISLLLDSSLSMFFFYFGESSLLLTFSQDCGGFPLRFLSSNLLLLFFEGAALRWLPRSVLRIRLNHAFRLVTILLFPGGRSKSSFYFGMLNFRLLKACLRPARVTWSGQNTVDQPKMAKRDALIKYYRHRRRSIQNQYGTFIKSNSFRSIFVFF